MKKLKRYKKYFIDNGALCPGFPLPEAVLIPKNMLKILQKIFFYNKDKIIKNSNSNTNLVNYLNTLFNSHKIFFIETNEELYGVIVAKSFYSVDNNSIYLYMTKNSNEYFLYDFSVSWNSIKSMLGHELIHQMHYIKQNIKNNFFA